MFKSNFTFRFWLLNGIGVLLLIGGLLLLLNLNGNDTNTLKPVSKHAATQSSTSKGKSATQTTSSVAVNTTPTSQPITPTAESNTAPHTSAATTPASSTTVPASTPSSQPAPTPQPTPTPTFHVALQLDQAFEQDLTYPFAPINDPVYQYITPFTVTFDTGFTQINPATMSCKITAAPAGSDMLCLASEKQASGFLSVQYYNDTPEGKYTVQVDYTIDGVTQSDAMQFNLTTLPATN